MGIDAGGQHVLERTSVLIHDRVSSVVLRTPHLLHRLSTSCVCASQPVTRSMHTVYINAFLLRRETWRRVSLSRFLPEGGPSWADGLPTSSSGTCHSEPCSACAQSQLQFRLWPPGSEALYGTVAHQGRLSPQQSSSETGTSCRYVEKGLHYRQQDQEALSAHVCCVEDTQALRDALPRLGLIGFVGNGAILPRCTCIHFPVMTSPKFSPSTLFSTDLFSNSAECTEPCPQMGFPPNDQNYSKAATCAASCSYTHAQSVDHWCPAIDTSNPLNAGPAEHPTSRSPASRPCVSSPRPPCRSGPTCQMAAKCWAWASGRASRSSWAEASTANPHC